MKCVKAGLVAAVAVLSLAATALAQNSVAGA